MRIIQDPLLSFNDLFKLDHSERLHLVLETIDAEKLLWAIDGDSPQFPQFPQFPGAGSGAGSARPNGYPARVLWSALIAGVVYRVPSVAELVRNLGQPLSTGDLWHPERSRHTQCFRLQSLPASTGPA